jgi:hypothetical protein
MIVIDRNGRQTVITGWRAWLIGAAVFVGLTALFAVIAVFVLGIALTLSALLLIAIPVAVGVALLASLFSRR